MPPERSGGIRTAMRRFLAPTGFLLSLLALPGCDNEQDGCTPGYETCECTEDLRCLSGLSCFSNLCVDPSMVPAPSDPDDTRVPSDPSDSGDQVDNAAACHMFLDSIACSPVAGVWPLRCEDYGELPCDVSAYFDCLADETVCTNGQLDATGWGSCASLASCA